MTANRIIPFALVALCIPVALGQAELVPNQKVRDVFAGPNELTLLWTNKGTEQINVELIGKVFQAGGNIAIVLPLEIKTKLQLFPNQTALVPASIVAPDVRGKTTLLVQWHAGSEVIGTTELTVFPRDILHELELLAGETPMAVVTCDDIFRNAFKIAKAKFHALERNDAGDYKGKLMIVKDASLSIESLHTTLSPAAVRGATVVCILPDGDEKTPLRPTFFATQHGRGVIVFVQDQFIENFDINPESQSRLADICRLATKPGRTGLPIISKD